MMLKTNWNLARLLTSLLTACVLTLGLAPAAFADHDDDEGCERGRPAQPVKAEPTMLMAPELTAAEAARLRDPALVERRELRRELRALEQDIETLEKIAMHMRSERLRGDMDRQIAKLRERSTRLKKLIGQAERLEVVQIERPDRRPDARPGRRPDARPDRHPDAHPELHDEVRPTRAAVRAPRRAVAMSARDFAALKRTMSSQAFDDDKLLSLGAGTSGAWLTTDQVRELVMLLSFSDKRLEALKLLHARTLDQERYHLLADTLVFQQHRRELLRALADRG